MARAYRGPPRESSVVVRRAPYQWTPATRSRSTFIHDGSVNGVRAGRPRTAAGVAHVREKMARRRDDEGRRAKTAASTSVVMVIIQRQSGRRECCVGAEARRARHTSRSSANVDPASVRPRRTVCSHHFLCVVMNHTPLWRGGRLMLSLAIESRTPETVSVSVKLQLAGWHALSRDVCQPVRIVWT